MDFSYLEIWNWLTTKDDTSFQDVENAIEDETRDENQEFWD